MVSDYKQKYLKYKIKYLNAKKKFRGGATGSNVSIGEGGIITVNHKDKKTTTTFKCIKVDPTGAVRVDGQNDPGGDPDDAVEAAKAAVAEAEKAAAVADEALDLWKNDVKKNYLGDDSDPSPEWAKSADGLALVKTTDWLKIRTAAEAYEEKIKAQASVAKAKLDIAKFRSANLENLDSQDVKLQLEGLETAKTEAETKEAAAIDKAAAAFAEFEEGELADFAKRFDIPPLVYP